jgi:YD repeat-containing protein
MGLYAETYAYNQVGNLLSLFHAGSDPRSAGWIRRYNYGVLSFFEPSAIGNRLSSTNDGKVSNYSYDKDGNLTFMPDLRMLQ